MFCNTTMTHGKSFASGQGDGHGTVCSLSLRTRRTADHASTIHYGEASELCDQATSDASADCAAGRYCRIVILFIGRISHSTIALTSSILKEDRYGRSNETPVEWIPQWHGLDTLLL